MFLYGSIPATMKEEKKIGFEKLFPSLESSDTDLSQRTVEKQMPIPEVNLGRGGEEAKYEPRDVKKLPGGTSSTGLKHLQCSSLASPFLWLEQMEALQGRKVANVKVKERQIAAKRFKSMGAQLQDWAMRRFRHSIKPIAQKENKNNWLELKERQEERQFVLTRIIKYLTDI